jgi:hypothetical protein
MLSAIERFGYSFPPSAVAASLFLSLPVCGRSSLLMLDARGCWRSQIQRQLESLVLYKSFTGRCIFTYCSYINYVWSHSAYIYCTEAQIFMGYYAPTYANKHMQPWCMPGGRGRGGGWCKNRPIKPRNQMQIFSLQLSPSWRDVFSPVDIRTV